MKTESTLQQVSKTILLANGEKPAHPIPLSMLKKAERIICCDGAISFLEELNINPHIIIGDCDSISSSQKEKFKSIIRHDDSQNDNDLQKALKYCIENRWDDVVILGASGLREDHFLANIGILMHYSDKLSLCMVTNYGVFTPIHKTTTFESYPGQQVSVFSFSPETEITYQGLKYPIYKQKFKELWEGSLNEAIDKQFSVIIEGNGAVLVYGAFID